MCTYSDHDVADVAFDVQGTHSHCAVCDGRASLWLDYVRIMCGNPRCKNEQGARCKNEHCKNECPVSACIPGMT